MNAPQTFAQKPTLSPDEAQTMRDLAWERFMADYLGCVDKDPGSARARYYAEIASIDALCTADVVGHDRVGEG